MNIRDKQIMDNELEYWNFDNTDDLESQLAYFQLIDDEPYTNNEDVRPYIIMINKRIREQKLNRLNKL